MLDRRWEVEFEKRWESEVGEVKEEGNEFCMELWVR